MRKAHDGEIEAGEIENDIVWLVCCTWNSVSNFPASGESSSDLE